MESQEQEVKLLEQKNEQKPKIVEQAKTVEQKVVSKEIHEQSNEIEVISRKFEKLKEFSEQLDKKYSLLTRSEIRSDLASIITAASVAYEKIQDNTIKSAARGLALAAIGKLHIEVDKL